VPEFPLTSAYWPADSSAPTLETTIGSILRDAATRAPDKIALIDGDPDADPDADPDGAPDGGQRRRWTYAELLAEAERAARALLTRFAPGQRVAVWSANSPEWIILDFGAALAGLTLVTVNPANQGDELAHVLGHSAADGLVMADAHQGSDLHAILAAVRDRLPALREVISFGHWDAFTAKGAGHGPLPPVAPDDVAQLLYTSGTTGRPKGALLTHRGLTNNARLAFQTVGIGPDDVLVNPMPMFHVGGGLFTLGTVAAGATQVLMPRFSPARQLELIETYRATALLGVPTMMNAMMGQLDAAPGPGPGQGQGQADGLAPGHAGRDVSSLRVAISGGAVSPPALVRRIESRLGLRYSISLAQTEASCSITMASADDSADDRAETLGRPLPQTEVRIVDLRTGQTAACGAVGEICARGYLVMRGYLDAPEATAAAIDADGWLHTGDLGSMDQRGYLRIAGRIKDMIIRGGENVYPREIEEVLTSHPAVAEASVLGFPDDHYGEVVAAAIRPSAPSAAAPAEAPASGDDDLAAELADFCRARLAAYKVPARWLITDAFPLTASGKIRKDVLRDQLHGQP
jgi:fatty-acyl-CoA synthase